MALPPVWFEATDHLAGSSETPSQRGGTHAKRFGTTLTACGLNAANFDKAWSRPFGACSVDPCPQCVTLTARDTVRTTCPQC
jgi:hypothetical protein